MAIRIYLRLFICSILAAGTANAQYVNQWSLDAIRVGIDPVKSWSMLSNADKHLNRPVYFNFIEGFIELQVHQRTSIVLEAGYSNSNWNRLKNTFFYNSKGTFFRFGLDFNVTEPDPDYEVDLGWRIGFNSFKEKGRLALHGDYWKQDISDNSISPSLGTYWGELLLDLKYRVFRNTNNHHLRNIWFNTSFRLRFKQNDLVAEKENQYIMIPGYGFNNRFMGGVHFGLSYFFKIRERKVFTLHHIHDSKILLHHR